MDQKKLSFSTKIYIKFENYWFIRIILLLFNVLSIITISYYIINNLSENNEVKINPEIIQKIIQKIFIFIFSTLILSKLTFYLWMILTKRIVLFKKKRIVIGIFSEAEVTEDSLKQYDELNYKIIKFPVGFIPKPFKKMNFEEFKNINSEESKKFVDKIIITNCSYDIDVISLRTLEK